MPLDASIYSQIKPYTMADPLETAGKVFTLQNAAMGMEKNRRAFAEDDAVKAAARESGGDPEKMSQLLLAGGQVDKGLGIRKTLREEQKAELERRIQQAKLSGNAAMGLHAQYQQALQASGGDKEAAIAAVQPIWEKTATQFGMQPGQFNPDENYAHIGGAERAAAFFTSQLPHFNSPTPAMGPDGKPALIQTDQRGGPARTVQGFAPPVPGTELSKLIAARDALPADHPDRAKYDQAITNETTANRSKGTNVTVNAPGPMLPGKTAQGKIDENVLDTTQHLARLSTIDALYQPKFQNIGTRAGMTWSAIKEKAGVDLTNKEKTDLTEFSAYKRNAIDAMNRYIKEITGAAMSEMEAQRIIQGLPNPGSGLFDGDSPTQFKAKMDDAIKQAKVAVSRAAYLKRNGMSLEDGTGKGITLERMPSLMNSRGQEIEAKLKQDNQGITDPAMKRLVRRQLAIEFGLSSD